MNLLNTCSLCVSVKHCRILQLFYLGASVDKKGQLFPSSSALPSAGSLGTVHSKHLSSLQTQVPAETTAVHQAHRLVTWCHGSHVVKPNTHTDAHTGGRVF